MHLIDAEILADARGLSLGLCLTGIVLGLALWLLGWWGHRFWVVLGMTVLGGVYGLYEAQLLRSHPLVAGVLLALAAGLLALSLVRLLAFAAGGAAALLLVQSLIPTWDQPLVSFIAGGLLGVLLFRLLLMTLTSLLGTVLTAYSCLCLADGLGTLNAVAWSQSQAVLLNWVCGLSAGLGVVVQVLLERWGKGKKSGQGAKGGDRGNSTAGPRLAWLWGGGSLRKAG
jgi:hypothetical protein